MKNQGRLRQLVLSVLVASTVTAVACGSKSKGGGGSVVAASTATAPVTATSPPTPAPPAPAGTATPGMGTAPATPAKPITKPKVIQDPSPNHSSRGGTKIDSIVIHTTEGGYAGSLSRLKSTSAQVSAHYIIKEDGSEIRQLVDDSQAAWAQTYYNSRGIGIECAGFSAQASTWNQGMKDSLYDLVTYLAKTYNVRVVHPTKIATDFPGDKLTETGLLSHGQIQPWDRSDPGPHFDWAALVKAVEGRIKAAP